MTVLADIPATTIIPGNNDRRMFGEEALRGLADSIRLNGLAQPITVRQRADGRMEIVAGERRFRAITEVLGWDTVPVIVRDFDDATAAAVMLAENTARVDLDPFEEGDAYHRRMEAVGTVEAVAEQAGVSPRRVRLRLELRNLGAEGRDLVRAGGMSIGKAIYLARVDYNRQKLAVRFWIDKEPTALEWRDFLTQLKDAEQQDDLFEIEGLLAVEDWKPTPSRVTRLSRRALIELLEQASAALPPGDTANAVADALEREATGVAF